MPLKDCQNCRVQLPIPEDTDREPLYASSKIQGEKERTAFEARIPPKFNSRESLIIAYKALRSLALDMNEKSNKLKALAAF